MKEEIHKIKYICDLCKEEMDSLDKNNKIIIIYQERGYCETGYQTGLDYQGEMQKIIKHICINCIEDIHNNFFEEYIKYKNIKEKLYKYVNKKKIKKILL